MSVCVCVFGKYPTHTGGTCDRPLVFVSLVKLIYSYFCNPSVRVRKYLFFKNTNSTSDTKTRGETFAATNVPTN